MVYVYSCAVLLAAMATAIGLLGSTSVKGMVVVGLVGGGAATALLAPVLCLGQWAWMRQMRPASLSAKLVPAFAVGVVILLWSLPQSTVKRRFERVFERPMPSEATQVQVRGHSFLIRYAWAGGFTISKDGLLRFLDAAGYRQDMTNQVAMTNFVFFSRAICGLEVPGSVPMDGFLNEQLRIRVMYDPKQERAHFTRANL